MNGDAGSIIKNASCEHRESDTFDASVTKEMLEVALSCISDALFILGESGAILFLNKSALDMCGVSHTIARGSKVENLLDLITIRTMEPCGNIMEKLFQYGFKREHRCLLNQKDGNERTVIIIGEHLESNEGHSIGTLLIVRDITEKEMCEEELFKIRKLESVGLFAGGIAHNFNNILTGIITNLFMARMSAVGNDEACRLIADAEKTAFKATKLTKQLLTFSSGGAPVKEVLAIDRLIEETVGFSLSGSNVDYRLDFKEHLRMVEADKGLIDQVLNSLILNAAQAMPQGGTVYISAENYTMKSDTMHTSSFFLGVDAPLLDGEYVKISIRDEGMGIPKKVLGTIFDPYFSTKMGNTGLGLTTAYSIVKKHGGYIEVDSSPGKGSTFSVYLLAKEEDTESTIRDNVDDTLKSDDKGGKILVMDDDVIIRTVVDKLLRKTGYKVECVSNGSEAIKMYQEAFEKKDPFTFVIMDLTIPGGMGGKETIKKLKEFDKDAKVVVFSGYSNDPILTHFQEYGFDGVLKKPFSTDELLQLIKNIARR